MATFNTWIPHVSEGRCTDNGTAFYMYIRTNPSTSPPFQHSHLICCFIGASLSTSCMSIYVSMYVFNYMYVCLYTYIAAPRRPLRMHTYVETQLFQFSHTIVSLLYCRHATTPCLQGITHGCCMLSLGVQMDLLK